MATDAEKIAELEHRVRELESEQRSTREAVIGIGKALTILHNNVSPGDGDDKTFRTKIRDLIANL